MDTKIAHKIEMHNMMVELVTKDTSPDTSRFKKSLRDQLLVARAELIEHLMHLEPENPNYEAIVQTINTFRQPVPFSPKLKWLPYDAHKPEN